MHAVNLQEEALQPGLDDLRKGAAIALDGQEWQRWMILQNLLHENPVVGDVPFLLVEAVAENGFGDAVRKAAEGPDD